MSINHQFVEFSDRVVRRYVKTVLHRVSGYRTDPHRPENRLDFLLATPDKDIEYTPVEEGRPIIKQIHFTYDEEVLELYSDTEVKTFERWNKALLESGSLKEYTFTAPELNTTNLLTDDAVEEIAGIKQLAALRNRLEDITSEVSLKRIRSVAVDLNRSVNVIKAIEDRINAVK